MLVTNEETAVSIGLLPWVLAIVSVILTACAQLLLKHGVAAAMVRASGETFGSVFPLAAATEPTIWLGVGAMGLSLITWMATLSKLDVSQAYPFTAVGIVLTIVGGRYLFGEPVSVIKATGAAIIVLGVIVVSRA